MNDVIKGMVLGTVALLLAGSALAQEHRPGGMGLGAMDISKGFGPVFTDELNLTESQRTQIAELNQAFQEEHRDALARFKAMRQEMMELRKSGGPQMRGAMMEIGEKYDHPGRELMPAFDELWGSVMSVLEEDQREKASERREELMRRGPRMGPRNR